MGKGSPTQLTYISQWRCHECMEGLVRKVHGSFCNLSRNPASQLCLDGNIGQDKQYF